MVQRPIRILGDPVLRSVCGEVESFDRGLVSLVADLEETVASPGRAGLAANQIGDNRCVALWQQEDRTIVEIINPRLSNGAAPTLEAPRPNPMLQAVEQMGLKLEPQKDQVEMIIVDHIEKTPTDN